MKMVESDRQMRVFKTTRRAREWLEDIRET
jgi:hypothetical protein